MSQHSNEQFDVAIIGAGFEGGLLGTILAANGAKVLMIESGMHPRFAVGESTVRHVFRMLKIMGERFNVPEISEKFSSGQEIHDHVTTACGEKRNFGFIYHRPGEKQIPKESTQLVIPPFREGYEAHLYRQDIDSFLTYSAVGHGATVKYNTRIAEVDINDKEATISTTSGEEFRARYVVDGSGYRSVLANKYGVRETPTRLKHHSRCLFTHMVNITPYDDCVPKGTFKDMKEPWYSGTCHHIFDGGWLWIIPFNNREGSSNPQCSIGLTLDTRRWPKPTDITPQQEFDEFLKKFPAMAPQFAKAKTTRDWVSTDRLQFSSTQVVGDRWCLSAHASGFIDALFSRGLANACEFTNAAAGLLLKAIKDDDFSKERFEYLERLSQTNIDFNDMMVNCAFISFRDFDLWNAWFRVWALGVGLGDLRLTASYRKFKNTHDVSVLPDAEEPMGVFYAHHHGYKEFFLDVVAKMEAVDAGLVGPKEAARYIFQKISEADFHSPANKMAIPEARCINVGAPITLIKTVAWALTSAPPEIKEYTLGVMADLIPNRFTATAR